MTGSSAALARPLRFSDSRLANSSHFRCCAERPARLAHPVRSAHRCVSPDCPGRHDEAQERYVLAYGGLTRTSSHNSAYLKLLSIVSAVSPLGTAKKNAASCTTLPNTADVNATEGMLQIGCDRKPLNCFIRKLLGQNTAHRFAETFPRDLLGSALKIQTHHLHASWTRTPKALHCEGDPFLGLTSDRNYWRLMLQFSAHTCSRGFPPLLRTPHETGSSGLTRPPSSRISIAAETKNSCSLARNSSAKSIPVY